MTARAPLRQPRTADHSTIQRRRDASQEAREFWLGLGRDIAALVSICLFIAAFPTIAAGFFG